MCGNLRKEEIGHVFDRCRYEDTFIWKIPNISSIPHEVDYVVHSPSFFYEGASWVFKMYPYGQSECETEGHVDLKIERLYSEFEKQVLNIKVYYESPFNKDFQKRNERIVFNSNTSGTAICKFMQNLKECPKRWQYAPNDILTLVFALNNCNVETDISVVCKRGRYAGRQEIGEVFKDNFNFECFFWKVCGLSNFEYSEDYQFQSPPISFANATWILKLYPFFRMPQSNNPSFDVVLERLHSEIDEHYIILHLNVDHAISCYASMLECFFDVHHTQGSALTMKLEEDNLDISCLHFNVEVKVKVDVRTHVGSLTKFGKLAAGIKALRDFKELYFNQEDCDVIIKVKGVEFPAHKNILKARSPVLASTFRNDMKEKATGIIDIEDCEPSSFSDFLCFLYCCNVENLSAENVFSLFMAADKYDVKDLRMECIEFMKSNLCVDIFCDIIALAFEYSENELIEITTDFYKDNLQEIIQTDKWQSFLIEYPVQSNELLIKALVNKK